MSREAVLELGAKGEISQRLLHMFTEAKRVNTNEQHMDEEQNIQLVIKLNFIPFYYCSNDSFVIPNLVITQSN